VCMYVCRNEYVNACMCVCKYVWMHVFIYIDECMYGRIYICMSGRMYVCMGPCTYVWTHISMYVCMFGRI
jgi:hypothetical protein